MSKTQARHVLIGPSPDPVHIGASNFFMALKALQAMECSGLITRQQRISAELELDLSQTSKTARRCVLHLNNPELEACDHNLHLEFL